MRHTLFQSNGSKAQPIPLGRKDEQANTPCSRAGTLIRDLISKQKYPASSAGTLGDMQTAHYVSKNCPQHKRCK
eukprot:g52875.t1